METRATNEPSRGQVILVGAGPGARDLITVRGLDCLRQAEVVVYDDLAAPTLLDEAPAAAERIYAGKRGGAGAALEQSELCALLVERARAGKRVVRLKGGDPFVFGRGGEEAEALAAAGVRFEVVPGISSAIAAPAFAGIPVTHRELADGFEVWTGHQASPPRARTAVMLMGARKLAENAALLERAGFAPTLPAALIEHGCTARQRTVVATLGSIAEVASAEGLGSPAVLVVGETVALRERIRWFETRPLFGRRVLVTRARQQAAETCRALEAAGAETVAMPTIAIQPEDPGPLREAVRSLSRYQFLILTSANAVGPLREALAQVGLDARALAGLRICAIGPGTAAVLSEALGIRADLVPADHCAEGILEALGSEPLSGKRVLLPRAARAREILPEELRARGAEVDLVPVYRTGLPGPEETRAGLEALEAGEVDTLSFTSASTAENFAALLGPRLAELTAGKLVVAIGPVTRDACRAVGIEVEVIPERYTIESMVDALCAHLRR